MKTKVNIANVGGLVVGAVAANYVSNTAGKMLPSVGKFGGVAPVLLGWFLMSMKGDLIKGAGAGMVAAGGAKLIGGFMPNMSVNEELSGVLTEDVTEDVSEVLTEDLSEVLTEDLSEDMTEDLSGYGEDLTEDLTEDLA